MMTEWERAVRQACLATLQSLQVSGADINARDRYGQTSLMLATMAGHANVVAWLIAAGAALDHTAKYGLTALMLAVVRGEINIVRMLVEAGADTAPRGTGAPGFAGKTALDLAVARGASEMVALLQRRRQPC